MGTPDSDATDDPTFRMVEVGGNPDAAARARTAGVVLAGGGSARMGVDKATLVFRGLPLLEHMVRLVAGALGQDAGAIRVSGDRAGYACIPDEATGRGPLGGIASCLRILLSAPEAARPDIALFVPVDMPRLGVGTLAALVAGLPPAARAAHYAVSELPLVCRVTEANADLARRLAAAERRSIRGLLAEAGACGLDPGRVPAGEFTNLNTPDEWRAGSGIFAAGTVGVTVFAGLAEVAGCRVVHMPWSGGTVAGLRAAIAARRPAAAALLARSSVVVDGRHADDGDTVPAGADIAILPPVSGG